MSPETLNTLSYMMGLALMFNFGFFVGGYMQRRAIINTFGNALERVETLFRNLFKREGKNEKTQDDRHGHAAHYHDGVGFVHSPQWQEVGKASDTYRADRKDKAAGLGSGTGADNKRTGKQGRESVGGETGRSEEGDCDRAGAVA